MRTHVPRRLVALLVLGAVAFAPGCQDRDRSSAASTGASTPSRAATSPSQPTRFTGTLQSGVVAIGAETTGWRIIGDGQTGGFDVDVSKLQARAKQLDGKRVTITGRMTTRSWPERGETQVLVAEKIEPAPAPGAK